MTCKHPCTDKAEQQGFTVRVCRDCGATLPAPNVVRVGFPRKFKKLLEYAPWAVRRRRKKRREKEVDDVE
jgi:hypothetical protein